MTSDQPAGTSGPAREPRPDLSPRQLLLAAVIGAVIGAGTWAFLKLLGEGIHLLWHTLPEHVEFLGKHERLTTIGLCTIGGLLVGILHRSREVPTGFRASVRDAEEVEESEGREDSGSQDWQFPALLGLSGLVFGASLGPEAVLVVVIGALARRANRILHVAGSRDVTVAASLGALFGGPLGAALLIERDPGVIGKRSQLLRILVSSSAGLLTISLLPGGSGLNPFHFDDQSMGLSPAALLWAAAAAALGVGLGMSLKLLEHRFSSLGERLIPRVGLRSLVAGLVMGLMAAAVPIVRFSGHHESQELIDSASSYGALALLGIAVWKVLATLVVLAGNFLGGEIFPAIFAGIAGGLALASLGAPMMAACAAGAVAAASAALEKPVAGLLIVALFLPLAALPYAAIGAAAAFAGLRLLRSRPNMA